MSNENYDFIVKCIFVGDSGVGKTSLINRYIKNTIPTNINSTLGVEYHTSIIIASSKYFKLQIWDLAGQENFRVVIKSFYRNSAIVFFVFDVTNKDSLLSINNWIDSINSNNNDYLLVLIANKNDLDTQRISKEDIDSVLERYKCLYFETSAFSLKSGEKIFSSNTDISTIFKKTIDKLLEYNPDLIQDLSKNINDTNNLYVNLYNGISINRNKMKIKKCC